MRIIYILIALGIIFGWAAFELRNRNRSISRVIAGFSALFFLALLIAMLGLY